MTKNLIRVGVLGNVDAGKSTFIGTQVSGQLDNGRGSARSTVMKHRHELETGRTSSIGTHEVYFDENAQPMIAPRRRTTPSTAELVQKASKIVSFMDVAGHEKYLKTTIAGINRGMADYALVLVNSSRPPSHMTLHHLKLCSMANIPVAVVMTKVDRTPSDVFRTTKQQVQKLLRHPQVDLKPYVVKNFRDIDTVGNLENLTPIVSVSSVTGEGMDLVRHLLLALPPRHQHAKEERRKPFECLIQEIYQLTGVGTVLSGFVTRGEWKKGEALHIGPLKDGSTFVTVPKSVHVAQTIVNRVWAGHTVCFAIPKPPRNARAMLTKFMVAKKEPIVLTKTFQAEIEFPPGKGFTLTRGRAVVTAHILHIKTQLMVVGIKNQDGENVDFLRQSSRATVTFEFNKRPQHVRPGMRVMLREGHVLGFGLVL